MMVEAWWTFEIKDAKGKTIHWIEDVLVQAEYSWELIDNERHVQRDNDNLVFKFKTEEPRPGTARKIYIYNEVPAWLAQQMLPAALADESLTQTLDSNALEASYNED